LCFVVSRRYLTVGFGSSLSEAVLKFYPAVDEAASVSHVCLRFSADISSSAVQLLMTVSEDNTDNTTRHSDGTVNHHQLVDSGIQSKITILRGRQYVILTAKKIKVTRMSDRVMLRYIWYSNGPCESRAIRK